LIILYNVSMKNTSGYTHWVIVILILIMAVGLVGVAWYYEENKEEGTTILNINQSTKNISNINTSVNTNSVVDETIGWKTFTAWDDNPFHYNPINPQVTFLYPPEMEAYQEVERCF